MKSKLSNRIAATLLVVTLVAGCKLMDDGVESGFAGTPGGDQSGTAQGSAPTIWGDPQRAVLAGTNYAFRPDAEDPDGDVLEFSIQNKPEWAQFDTTSGLLHGIPTSENVGRHTNVVISVSDANSIVSLPSFSIKVDDSGGSADNDSGDGSVDDGSDDGDADSSDGSGDDGTDDGDADSSDGDDSDDGNGGVTSTPPTITGKPNTSVVAGSQYVFKPAVEDPDSDELSFSIVNKPNWANFNTTTGRLGGWPKSQHIGTTRNIEISVSDGTSIAALSRFSITVEPVGTTSIALEWNAPTLNSDGSPLVDLAGYRIYYGTASKDYSEMVELPAGVTSYVIDGLAPGRYYIAMTSFNGKDLESDHTNEIRVDAGG